MSTTLRAETELIATKSSVLADVGTESTDAGWANTLFSETSEAVVCCRIISPVLIFSVALRSAQTVVKSIIK